MHRRIDGARERDVVAGGGFTRMMRFRVDLAENKVITQADQAICEQYVKIC